MEPERIEEALRAHFAATPPEAAAAWLYGSVARGTARTDSDVDVGLLLGRAPTRTLEELPFDLEAELGRLLGRDVQIVILDDAPADLVHRVLRDGRLLFEADRSARIAFEVRSRNEYFDLLPVLLEYRTSRGSRVTDEALVAKRLAFVETCLHELRTLARPEVIDSDVRERRFVEHTLQLAIQAGLDVASHVVADERLGEPETRADLFDLLQRAGWLPRELGDRLVRMAGMRNVLVHGYTAVDLKLVRDVVENHLGDLDEFVAAVRSRLGS